MPDATARALPYRAPRRSRHGNLTTVYGFKCTTQSSAVGSSPVTNGLKRARLPATERKSQSHCRNIIIVMGPHVSSHSVCATHESSPMLRKTVTCIAAKGMPSEKAECSLARGTKNMRQDFLLPDLTQCLQEDLTAPEQRGWGSTKSSQTMSSNGCSESGHECVLCLFNFRELVCEP